MPSPLTHGAWYVLLKRTETPGPNGNSVSWEDSERFVATPYTETNAAVAMAEVQAGYTALSFSVAKDLAISMNDYFRNEAEPRRVYQVQSDPEGMVTPRMSRMDFKDFKAKLVELPEG
ncbi:hypothetical protein LJC49_07150 [Ruminococcaceae bacterium OttesenSCG-928-I18]|nr:hypothetical protein [Ruminococcaceae bacterium OttesenSCG-928-I18]